MHVAANHVFGLRAADYSVEYGKTRSREVALGDWTTSLKALIDELKRRKVVRVAIVYGVVGIAVIEASDALADALDLGDTFVTFVAVTALLGYPIAIVLAWAYELVPDSVSRQIRSAPGSESTKQEIRKAHLILYRGVLSVALIAIVVVVVIQYRGTFVVLAAPKSYLHSIAVMPLDNLTGDSELDHVGKGTSLEITRKFQGIGPLRSIDFQSLQAAGAENLTIAGVINEHQVRHVLWGWISFDEFGRLRADIQLYDETGDLLDSKRFNAETDDTSSRAISTFQGSVSTEVVNLVLDAMPGLPSPAIAKDVDFGPGHRAWVEGSEALATRTATGIRDAIQWFEESIRLDPDAAPAYASLAQTYALALFYRYDVGIEEYELAARSLAMSNFSLDLDPNLAEGFAARGYLGALTGNDPLAVKSDFDRAIELRPNSSITASWRARSLALLGEMDEAVAEAERAIDLGSRSAARRIALAELLLQIGEYETAARVARDATDREPGQYRSLAIEARALLLDGRANECRNLILGPYKVLHATCLYEAGDIAASEALISEAVRDLQRDERTGIELDYSKVLTYEDLAIHFAWIGDPVESARWADRAFEQSPAGIEVRVFESELFDTVRDRSDFENVIGPRRARLYGDVVDRSREFSSSIALL
jgi:TolB-like protein/tetratricopeptide (TPR) repeat protein